MSHCRHTHHEHSTTADIWTKMAAVGEGTASLISDAYWIGGLIDLAAQLDDDGYGLSWYGMGFGTALALVTAVGSAYSHSMLNINHQAQAASPIHEAHEGDTEQLINTPADFNHHQPAKLSWPQRAALLGDYISHTGDMAGPITFIANIAAKDRLPIWGKAIIQCGATLFGGVSSLANVRTCKNSMLELNEKHSATESRRACLTV